MKILRALTVYLFALAAFAAGAQSRSVSLTVQVTSVPGDYLGGQSVHLVQTDYSAEYPGLTLGADGSLKVNVYPGNHRIEIERDGFDKLSQTFAVAAAPKEQTVSFSLAEKTRQPFALTATVDHDVMAAKDDILLEWNHEPPVFFDDFDSYSPWAVAFGQWTGIDADGETTAALAGSYPNRGIKQYAQIINPLTVVPTWWYDYPVLRPYSGQQYLGFIRTSSGAPNDDWLISPVLTPGTENVLQFMAKAADQYAERFQVYVTEKTDNPAATDFIRLDEGNDESVDYRQWTKMTYDLSAYAGKPIRFAIRYVGRANVTGAFMLMIDDVFVGHASASAAEAIAARRVAKSPDNANETFKIFLDSQLVGTTSDYSYRLTDVAAGVHTIGVQACYLAAESEVTTINVDLTSTDYSAVTIKFATNSILAADGATMELVDMDGARAYTFTVKDGKVTVPSLPYGTYRANIAEGAFSAWSQTFEVAAPTVSLDAQLTDNVIAPWNITATTRDDGSVLLLWNQNLGFTDSFETYDDFATGTFGGWVTLDCDRQPVYPIALGSASNIVSFPGSGTATNPTAIAPMVFNPWHTSPAMLPTDQSIAAPDGDKTVIFFSPQRAKADKWLITPQIDIHKGYEFSMIAKAYDAAYPEKMEIMVSEGSTDPADFTPAATVGEVNAGQWMKYVVPLDTWEDSSIRIGIHYISTDAFLAQVDVVTVGPAEGQADQVDYGNVVQFEIYLDGVLHGTSPTPQYVFNPMPAGNHTIGVRAVYKGSASPLTEYAYVSASIDDVTADELGAPATLYDLTGRKVSREAAAPGVYIAVRNGNATKILIK